MKYLFILLSVLTYNGLSSQEAERKELVLERVNYFSSSDRIEEILVQKDIVWFAGKKGITSYDNQSTKINDVLSLSNAVAVIVSKRGNVFSAFSNNKIYMNDSFMHFIDEPETNITDLELYNGSLWVATNKGIYVFNTRTRKLSTIYTSKSADMKSNNITFLQYFKTLDKLYVGTDKGIIEIKDNASKWKTSKKGEVFIASTESIDGMWLLSDKELWLVYTE